MTDSSRAKSLWFLVAIGLIQIALGADILVLLLSLSSIVIGFWPLFVLGRDLYTILAAIFCLRYTGAALLIKTIYGQPVDSLLQSPLGSYLVVNGLMLTIVGAIVLARKRDAGTTIFPVPANVASLRTLSLVAFASGTVAAIVTGYSLNRFGELVGGGPVIVISYALSSLTYLGYACEALYSTTVSGRRKLFSTRMIAMMAITVAVALFLNIRSLIVNVGVCIFICGFLARSISWRTIGLAGLGFYIFANFLSPIMLDLRTWRDNQPAGDFLGRVVEVVTRSITDQGYLDNLRSIEKFRTQYEQGTVQYDYFGDNSNIGNRAAFVGLLDSIYSQVQVVGTLGTRPLTEEVVPRLLPSFLVDKQARDYGYGDWLSWQLGIIESGRIAYLSFALPMEGYASFGLVGCYLFPGLGLLIVLLVVGRISSLRVASPTSIYLLSALHWDLFEGASETYVSLLVRTLPMLCIPLWLYLWVVTREHAMAGGARSRR